MLGVMSPQEALREAINRDLDLVEISPAAQPPVCKIMDFGKFKYELKKKNQAQRKSHGASVIKEITLSPQTDEHDLNFKVKNCIRFLSEGHRVKVTVRYRGREMSHPEIGIRQMEKILEALKLYAITESAPKMEGKALITLFIPQSSKGKVQPKPQKDQKEVGKNL